MKTVSIHEVPNDNPEAKARAAKWMLWLSIVSILMFFGAFTSYYIVRKAGGSWLEFELPQMFWISTAIILVSSVTMNWAVSSAKKDDFKNVRTALTATIALGLAFGLTQVFGWSSLYSNGIVVAGTQSNASGSLMYLLTALHLIHLLAGLINIGIVMRKAAKGKYSSQNLLGIKLCATYWHFLDALWIYLFLFLFFIR